MDMEQATPPIVVQGLTLGYGSNVILQDVTFTIRRNEIFIIMGGSGGGKSTVLRSMVGLLPPMKGHVLYGGVDFWTSDEDERKRIMRTFGILYQGGALWSSLTLAENVALPLEQYSDLGPERIRDIVSFKLSLVGLSGFEHYYPSQISGGMKKRAGLARAMALDPEILFFDEPSAGLDPVSARHLDELILELRSSLNATVVVVTHDLASIFAIGGNAIFLDAGAKTMIAEGHPATLLAESCDARVTNFLARGQAQSGASGGLTAPPSR